MSKRRWPVLLGPPLLFVAVLAAVIGLAGPPARAGESLSIARLGACGPGHQAGGGGAAPQAAWWKTIDRTDRTGALVARQVFLGSATQTVADAVLPVESSVSGPVRGLVVVTMDDGLRSVLQLADVGGRCSITIDRRADVIRNAILDPTDGTVFAHLVARDTRADLGTFRFTSQGPSHWTSALVGEPLSGALATEVGQVYGTGLALDAGSRHLAVQSCTDLACLTRVFDLAHPGAAPRIIRGDGQGPLLGFAGPSLVTWAACVGDPCPVLAWDLVSGRPHQLAAGADAAALTGDGRRLVAYLASENGGRLTEIDVASGRSTRLRGVPAGSRPLAMGPGANTGLEVLPDEVALAIPGGDPFGLNPDSAAEEAIP